MDFAQQPEEQPSPPIPAVRAKSEGGSVPDFWPRAGRGLVLNLSGGSAFCGNPRESVHFSGGTLVMTPDSKNYVYLDPAVSCTPDSNTTGFAAGQIPLAIVVTDTSTINSVTNLRDPSADLSIGDGVLPRQEFNVLAYGAKCDGSTDNASAFAATLGAMAGYSGAIMLIPPCPNGGKYVLRSARLAVLQSNVKVSGYGAVIVCAVADDCITLGSLSNPIANNNITIEGVTIEPGAGSQGSSLGNGYTAIRTNSQSTHVVDIRAVANGSHYFKNFIQNDDDQSMSVRGLNYNAGVVECDATYCGNAIYCPRGGAYSGVGWIADSLIDPECHGNGIDWESGNDLQVKGTVIQAYNQYGIRHIGGITTKANITQTHLEVGNCRNPLGVYLGQAGIIGVSDTISVMGGQPGGLQLPFPVAGTAGKTAYTYYLIVKNTYLSKSYPLPMGYVTNAKATINSTNSVALTWNDLEIGKPTWTYDILRVPTPASSPYTGPYGTGNWAVATGQTESSVCSGGVCSFTDNVTTPSSYTIPTPAYIGNNREWQVFPEIRLWPGAVVLSSFSGTCGGDYYGDAFNQGGFVTGCGTATFFGGSTYYANPQTSPAVRVYAIGGSADIPMALVLNGNPYGNKGIVNLGTTARYPGGNDKLTIWDSNPGKTAATPSLDPQADTADSAIGIDSQYGWMAFRSANSISFYIDHLFDGSSWLERLTPKLESFAVPVSAPSYSSGGTTFRVSGCSASSPLGGATAGRFTSGAKGNCTATITMGGSQTAPHGWTCWANDLTTPADVIHQTGGSTTTAILKGAMASGDLVNFGCLAY